jgi:hypothetical protein
VLHTHTLGNTLTEVLSPCFAISTMQTTTKLMSVAEIEISDRYPSVGMEWNTLPNDMIATVLAGKAILHTRENAYELVFGDVVEIPQGTEYFWECIAEKVRILAVNAPPFNDNDRKT